MSEQLVTNLIRLSFAAVAAAVVGFAPVSWAQEATDDNKIDLANLVFMDGNAYSVTYEDTVSRTATATAVVRKIEYGRTSFVNIVTTSSGVYSSDAMTSPHIRYPGVHVEQVPFGDERGHSFWPLQGSSIQVYRTPNAVIIGGNRMNCIVTRSIISC